MKRLFFQDTNEANGVREGDGLMGVGRSRWAARDDLAFGIHQYFWDRRFLRFGEQEHKRLSDSYGLQLLFSILTGYVVKL